MHSVGRKIAALGDSFRNHNLFCLLNFTSGDVFPVMASIPLPKVLQLKKESELELLIKQQVSQTTICVCFVCGWGRFGDRSHE